RRVRLPGAVRPHRADRLGGRADPRGQPAAAPGPHPGRGPGGRGLGRRGPGPGVPGQPGPMGGGGGPRPRSVCAWPGVGRGGGGAAAVAAVALAGPWRRDPLGPPGVIAAVTLGVIGLGLMTGSRLLLEMPFGLNVLEAGRFYGLGNNAVVIYGASGIVCAAWLGGALLRRGQDARARLVMAAVAAFTVIVAAWPGFGAKVGGTVAMLPGFLVLLLAAWNVRITWRWAAVIGVSALPLL